jgi:hypothetical protein
VRFTERRELRGDEASVWARVSDLGSIPKYWHGTREFRVREEAGKTLADVVFAFGGRGRAEVTVDQGRKALTISYLQGPIRGRQVTTVTGGSLESEWDVEFTGAYRLMGRWNEPHFRSGTGHALERLVSGSTD